MSKKKTLSQLPPGPTTSSMVQGIQMGKNPFEFLQRCSEQYGDVFTLRMPDGMPRVVIGNPNLVKEILALKPEQYDARKHVLLINFGENTILLLNGERHQQERKLLMPPLHGDHMKYLADFMRRSTDEIIDTWQQGQVLDIHPQLQKIILSVSVKSVFGILDDRSEVEQHVLQWIHGILTPTNFMISMFTSAERFQAFLENQTKKSLQTGRFKQQGFLHRLRRLLPWKKTADAKARVVDRLRQEITHYRANPDPHRPDVLATLAAAKDENGNLLAEDNIIDELITLLISGHETTATSLCWALLYILDQPAVVQKIKNELAQVFSDGQLNTSKIHELKYLEACILESMRLAPIGIAITRFITQDIHLGDICLPSNTMLWPSPFLAQRHPEFWGEDRETFRPERFLQEKTFPAHVFLPFGGGKRRCIGAAFAMYEMRIILAQMFLRAEIELAKPANFRSTIKDLTPTPLQGVSIRVLQLSHALERGKLDFDNFLPPSSHMGA